ncbi:MAG: acetylglutamate kinase [Candidatus Promineofilum sp.]|nr:acetylglutamate kinase [Promineifilum sp.]
MTRVIKIGGNEMNVAGFLEELAAQVAGVVAAEPVVIVHGGGQEIATLQTRLGIEPLKVDGLRVTDAASLDVAEMVLSGRTNKQIVRALLATGLDAVGLSGVDGRLLTARKKEHPTADLGLVGEIVAVRAHLLQRLLQVGLTPVISPISLSNDGQTYNVNADEAATAIAAALGAEALDFVSNVPGVLADGELVTRLSPDETETLIADGVISGGMIPKVRAALDALARGVPQVRIVDLAGLRGGGGTVFSEEAGQ